MAKRGKDKKKNAKVKPRKPNPARARSPRSSPLPGMGRVRNKKLDNICEAIADERTRANEAKTEERGLSASGLQEMTRAKIQVYRHAGVELSRIPGAEKLRIRLTKEEGDAGAEDLAGAGDDTDLDEMAVGEDETGDESDLDEGNDNPAAE